MKPRKSLGLSLLKFSHSLRNRHFLILDIFLFVLTPILSIAIRLEGSVNLLSIQGEIATIILIFGAIKLVTFGVGGLYKQMWQHASVDELAKIGLLGIMVLIAQTIAFDRLLTYNSAIISAIPISVPLIDGILTMFFVGGLRFSARLSERLYSRLYNQQGNSAVLIVGAGDAGVMIAGEMQSNPQLGLSPIGFVDDDPHKKGLKIRGIQVLGNRDNIPDVVTEFGADQIIIAMPTASGNVIREIGEICKQTGIRTRTIPGVFELLDGSVSVNELRDIAIEDLLRREPVKIDDATIRAQIQGKRVLVTGAGGSIGGELCRQLARFGPDQLILLGHGENSIFEIANDLSHLYTGITCSTVIADIRDRQRINVIMKRYRPELVYHAAAHKHVPLMELNPSEAVTNNIIGTLNLVDAASDAKVDHFVLISTDKAVNPTSVMGATKRVAELVVHAVARESNKPFIAVRFGNVLGSRGSVIPTFQQQIARGGPITVTHPEVKRYFMTIPEAVQLVLQAGISGKGGEVFVLDMGEPVKVADLARDLVTLSGLDVHKDIEIVYTGLRPGEKLFEELILDDEHFEKTNHEKIFVLRNGNSVPSNGSPNGQLCLAKLREQIEQLRRFATVGNSEEIRSYLKTMVPEFHYQIPSVPI